MAITVEEVMALLGTWHDAARTANEVKYFSMVTSDLIFIGTDDTEIWDLKSFRADSQEKFASPPAWDMRPTDTNIIAVADTGTSVWFMELLESKGLGRCRSTGCLRLSEGEWRVCYYMLSMSIPNDVYEIVRDIVHTDSL